MAVLTEKENGKYVVRIDGSFDAKMSIEAREIFENLLENLDCDVVIDMDQVDFLDSSGIGAVVFLYKRVKCAGYNLKLINVAEQPYTLIDLLRINKIIEVN